jgi:hypothetical protein
MELATMTAVGIGIVVVASAKLIWRRITGKNAEKPFTPEGASEPGDGFATRFLKASKRAYRAARKSARAAWRRIEASYAALKAALSSLFSYSAFVAPNLATLCFVPPSVDEFSKLELVGLRLPDTRAP